MLLRCHVGVMLGWGGVGWGGGVNVLSSAYSTCCYAAMWGLCWGGVGGVGLGGVGVLTFCRVRTVHVATLPRSRECLPRYMLLRCRDLGNICHVTCRYAAEISCGILATLHVATLPRSREYLPRYMLLRCRDLGNACHVTCCYAAEIFCGILAQTRCRQKTSNERIGFVGIGHTLFNGGTMQLSKRVCCRSCLKRCGAIRRKELADSSFDMLSLSRIDITKLILRCTNM